MRGDREGEGCNRNSQTDRDGILENVFCELIFNAIGVFLESENEGWEPDTSEV